LSCFGDAFGMILLDVRHDDVDVVRGGRGKRRYVGAV
jgi:hypothetical protein